MKIKRFKEFKIFEISGTELVGPMGTNYGDTTLPTSVPSTDTDVLYSDVADKIFTYDDYQTLYQRYLSLGGKPLSGFTKENLEEVVNRTMSKKSIMESNNIDKKKAISEIVYECLHDFCYINSLEYEIKNGRFYYKNRKRNANSRRRQDIGFVQEARKFKSHRCILISIINKNWNRVWSENPDRVVNIDKNDIEFRNAMSHLKNSLEKELSLIEFKVSDFKKNYNRIVIEILYE